MVRQTGWRQAWRSLFAVGTEDAFRLLNAGAGIGSLSDAFLRCWLAGGLDCHRVAVDGVGRKTVL